MFGSWASVQYSNGPTFLKVPYPQLSYQKRMKMDTLTSTVSERNHKTLVGCYCTTGEQSLRASIPAYRIQSHNNIGT